MFELERSSVAIDDNEFETFVNKATGKHYFAERINIKGMLQYGLVPKNEEVQISLADNGIKTPVTVEEIFAITPNGSADEVIFYLYVNQGGELVKIGEQKVHAGQMPYDIPNGILSPDMVLGIKPTRSAATITVYVKPVVVSFIAVPGGTNGNQ